MTKIEINTSDLNICLATLSLYICVYGLVSYVVKHRLYLSEPLIALLFGIIVGPAVLGWVDPNLWKPEEDRLMGYKDSLTLAFTRITIGIQVFFAGVALPKKYLKTEFQSLIILLLPIMAIAWFVCGFLIYELIPRLTFMEALLIAACITPTDPVLANSITKGRYADRSVKPSVRNIIVAESGANDGLGYPFIFLPLFCIMARSSEEFTGPNRHLSGIIGRWIYETWLYQVTLSVILGLAIGWIARKSLRWCEERNMLDEDNFIAYGIGLSFFCMGFLGIIGSDDLLCCFIAGNSFSWDDRQRLAAEDAGFQDVIDLLLNTAIFMYIGAIMPWYAFNDPVTGIIPWRIVVLGICVMLFRRLPWVITIYKLVPAIPSVREAAFVGWFGPIGVSAIFYVQVALEYLPKDSREQVKRTIEPVVYFMVFTSILVHGITVPASRLLMHGVTLTRTLTQPIKIPKGPTEPVNLDNIRRIGIAVPLPAYDNTTGERVVQSIDFGAEPRRSEPSTHEHTLAEAPSQADEGQDIEAGIEHGGRTVATKIEINTSDLNISLATLSLYICGYGLISYVVKHRLYLSEPLVALLFGIMVGPAVLGWVNPNLWKPHEDQLMGYKDSLTLALTRITIGIQVFFAGVALPKKYLKTEFQSLIVLLLPIMATAWFVCGFLIYELIPRLTFMEALLIAACITPTDPVLANSITRGRYADRSVKPSVRNIIVAESGANDGLGYPFIFLPLLFLMARSSEEFSGPNRQISGVIARWIYETWLYQIALSIVVGLLVGWVARKSLRWCQKREMLDEDNFIAYGTGLSFFCLGFLGIMSIGSDDLLCCFMAGNSFAWGDREHLETEIARFQDIIDLLLNAAIFMYIGAVMPWFAYNDTVTGIVPWRIVTLGICVMVFRRLPWVTAIYKLIPAIPSFKEALFVGWFGPIGVSAIFYVQIALEYLPKDSREQVKLTIEPIVYFMVFTSILVHGITVPAMKVVEHGATLTRTLTQTSNTVKVKPTKPISLSKIHRIGVAVPLPAYNSATGERVTQSIELDSHQMSSELGTRTYTNTASSPPSIYRMEGELNASPPADIEGRTVTFTGSNV